MKKHFLLLTETRQFRRQQQRRQRRQASAPAPVKPVAGTPPSAAPAKPTASAVGTPLPGDTKKPKAATEQLDSSSEISIEEVWSDVKNFNLNNLDKVTNTLNDTRSKLNALINDNNSLLSDKPGVRETTAGLIKLTSSLKEIYEHKSDISKCINFDTQITKTPIGEADNLCNQGKSLIEMISKF